MYAVKGKTWWAGIGTLSHSRSYHVCVNVYNLPENQVYSFYNLFGTCTVFLDCDSEIYQPLARKWTEQYNAKHESYSSLEPLWFHFAVSYFPFPSIHKQKWTTPNSMARSAPHVFFCFCFYQLVWWVCSDFQHQFVHQCITKIHQHFLVGNLLQE